MRIRILLLTFFLWSTAVANTKIGYIDMQKAITETKSGKKALKKLKSFQALKQKELDKKKTSMEKEQAELKKKFDIYSDEKKMQIQQDFQKKAIAAEQYFRESQVQLQKKEKDLLEPVLNGLRESIAKFAEKKGYVMIFEKNGSALLFATKSSNLTSEIVKAYGK